MSSAKVTGIGTWLGKMMSASVIHRFSLPGIPSGNSQATSKPAGLGTLLTCAVCNSVGSLVTLQSCF